MMIIIIMIFQVIWKSNGSISNGYSFKTYLDIQKVYLKKENNQVRRDAMIEGVNDFMGSSIKNNINDFNDFAVYTNLFRVCIQRNTACLLDNKKGRLKDFL